VAATDRHFRAKIPRGNFSRGNVGFTSGMEGPPALRLNCGPGGDERRKREVESEEIDLEIGVSVLVANSIAADLNMIMNRARRYIANISRMIPP
jgi:hypothetical protein